MTFIHQRVGIEKQARTHISTTIQTEILQV